MSGRRHDWEDDWANIEDEHINGLVRVFGNYLLAIVDESDRRELSDTYTKKTEERTNLFAAYMD